MSTTPSTTPPPAPTDDGRRKSSVADIFKSRLSREIPLLTADPSPLPPFITLSNESQDEKSCSLTFELNVETTAKRPTTLYLNTNLTQSTYPFSPPTFILDRNPHLPSNPIPLSLSWTPSLTVLDCVLDVSVRVRECVKNDEGWESLVAVGKGEEGAATASIARRRSTKSFKPANFSTIIGGGGSVKEGDPLVVSSLPNRHPCTNIRRLEKEKFSNRRRSTLNALMGAVSAAGKSVLEETSLSITPTHILEVKSSKFNLSSTEVCSVSRAYPVATLAKLKFRRGESISFTFKDFPSDQLVYMCATSEEVVKQVQAVMKSIGVKGKHSSAQEVKLIDSAVALVTTIQVKEEILMTESGSPGLVEEIMDLYRQAAEKFALAGDNRHEKVLELMRVFLKQPKVTRILDGKQAERKGADFSDNESDGEEDLNKKVEEEKGEVLEKSFEVEGDDDSDDEPVGDSDDVPVGLAESRPTRRGSEEVKKILDECEDIVKEIGSSEIWGSNLADSAKVIAGGDLPAEEDFFNEFEELKNKFQEEFENVAEDHSAFLDKMRQDHQAKLEEGETSRQSMQQTSSTSPIIERKTVN
ncbi:hypothetical protein TrVE_jg10228 [Triparma verrucosa]|uniref:Uncharacterized protein n=1 Tax=Triparma verrucosa TaxID=1606542 RepID=A0A9W7ELX8_9STRA|nr:hypothetical protein TrVE_jg10228 [Triparma verrucosa]